MNTSNVISLSQVPQLSPCAELATDLPWLPVPTNGSDSLDAPKAPRSRCRHNSCTAAILSLMMVSMTTWKTTWMLLVSVAVVKWG